MTPQPPQGPPQIPPQGQPTADLFEADQIPKAPDKQVAAQQFRQIMLSDRERQRLQSRIWDDAMGARSNHQRRIRKFERIMRMWRGLNVTGGNPVDGADFQVPMIKWVTFAQWARCMQALIGDDAEIVAEPRTPEGDRTATKVGKYTTWRFFDYMNALAELAPFVFRGILLGRSHAEIIYEQEYYWERDAKGNDKEVLCYDGPRMFALRADQLILPAQDSVRNVSEFAWKIRRLRLTPEQLLDGERRGRYQGIKENFRAIMGEAQQRMERDYMWDSDSLVNDQAEGVDHSTVLGTRDSVEVWQWYGKWRLPKGKRDSVPDNLDYRQVSESELLVTFIPHANLVIGVQDLRDLYPRMKKRDPFVDLAMVKDGSYWAPGLGEILEDLQNEDTINFKLFRKAGQLSVGPIILYKPSGGFDPQTFEYKPGIAIPSETPGDVQVIYMKADLSYVQAMQQMLKAMAELVTGVSDQTTGLSSDRPNAPRTASGQAMLLNEGNVRASLDMTMLRDDMRRIIGYVWQLDCEYADEEVFFRVTSDDPVGFDVNNGFGTMTAEDREHSFSFDLKFATSVWSREARKAVMMQLYALSMGNPLVQMNPRALWTLLNRVWEANGEKNFADIIPEPPETDRPKTPKEEWIEMQAGEIIHVNPLDDDSAHLLDHRNRLTQEVASAPDKRDHRLEKEAVQHIIEHENQKRRKMVLQELITAAANELQQQMGGQPPPGAPPSGPAGPGAWTPPMPPQPPTAAPGSPPAIAAGASPIPTTVPGAP